MLKGVWAHYRHNPLRDEFKVGAMEAFAPQKELLLRTSIYNFRFAPINK